MKKFSWSYTALQQFENCPCQYGAVRVLKSCIEEKSKEMLEGQAQHKSAELYLLGKQELSEQHNHIKPYADEILAMEGELLVEQQLAINDKLKPTSWFGRDAWGRGVIDAAVIKGDEVWIYDWKTGKISHDQIQAMIFCVFLGIHRPELQKFNTKFIWLKESTTTGSEVTMTRDDIRPTLKDILKRVAVMSDAYHALNFPPKKSGLCKAWCPNLQCHYNGKREDVW